MQMNKITLSLNIFKIWNKRSFYGGIKRRFDAMKCSTSYNQNQRYNTVALVYKI